MGLGDGTAPASLQQLGQRLIGIMLIGFPISILIALTICSIATVTVILVCEAGMLPALEASDEAQD